VKPPSATSLMTHMIAGYPSRGADLDVARGLIDGGAGYLEVQFPFSDPSADGVPIQTACMKALQAGFSTGAGFDLVRRIKSVYRVPVFIMSYGSLVYARGVQSFAREAADSGAGGLIVPDLMPGYDEGLFQAGRDAGIHVVPVVPPALSEDRLLKILAENPTYLYASLRTGITGSRTLIDGPVLSFLARLRQTGKWIFAGFGVQTSAQVRSLAGCADTVIVGSEIVRMVAAAVESGMPVYETVRDRVSKLLLEDGDIVEAKETDRFRDTIRR